MIASSTDSTINKSAINRHSCISHRRKAVMKPIPLKPMKNIIVKHNAKKADAKPAINEEPERQIINENIPRCIEKIPESKPIEEKIEQGPVKVVSIEDAVRTAVNDTPVERKIEMEQHSITKILDNRTTYTGRHYAYNSILGTHICYH